MKDQVLLVGEDQFFHSRELHDNNNIIHVQTSDEAISLLDSFEFSGIVARDGEVILKEVRGQGLHTPFLDITHAESVSDCCKGLMAPEASNIEKNELLKSLLSRNHKTDCC